MNPPALNAEGPDHAPLVARAGTRASPWIGWYRRAFPAYFLFLFLVNHFPGLRLPKVPGDDKLAHATAFGLLAFLAWRFSESFRPVHSPRFAPLLGFALVAYAAIDEWTQQFVMRGTDIEDWYADAGGVVIVLVALELLRRRRTPARQS